MAKKSTQKSPPHYILPTDNDELQTFSRKFKIDMMEQAVASIEFAFNNKLPLVEVFQFKDSDFVITISEKDYLPNLENIYSFYVKNESYEKCSRVVTLQKTLKEKSVLISSNEKTKS